MLALCRGVWLGVLPVLSYGVMAWMVANRLGQSRTTGTKSADYERLRRIYGTRPSVN
jgi:hypothetical protein